MWSARSSFPILLWVLGAATAAAGDIAWSPFAVEGYHGKKLDGEIGRLTVPVKRDAPDSGTLDLAFVRLPTTAASPAAPIVYLAGGPGGSGINLARIPMYFDTFRKLTAVADVVLLDQRGAGRSDPGLTCLPEADPDLALLADWDRVRAFLRERAMACRAELAARGVDLAGYTTNESADDLEDLRRALGVPRINLLGFSYGTHLALAAIRRHGDGLERVALVGVEGPDHTRKLPSSLDTQMRKLSLLASKDPVIGDRVPDLYGLLGRVLEKLEREPLRVPVDLGDARVTVPVTKEFLQSILLADLGDGNDLPVFPALIHTIDQGDTELLAWFVRKRLGRLRGAIPGLYFAMDGASGASPERWARIAREARGSIFGNLANEPFPEVNEVLGVRQLDESFRAPIVSDVETLFVSGTLDSNAPPYQAEEVRWGFTRGTHLVVENAGHEDMLGNPEVDAAIVDFFRGEDVATRRLARPAPRFLSVEQAKRNRRKAR